MGIYRTLSGVCTGVLHDRRSRFIGSVRPIGGEEEVGELMREARRAHPSARHWCYAYVLGADGGYERANDDGEPSGSAGRPILGALRRAGLTQVLGVVVRYFGGIKLGVPGLIAAYRGAIDLALESGRVEERRVLGRLRARCPYARQHELMGVLKSTGGSVEGVEYGSECDLVGTWPVGRLDEAAARLSALGPVEVLSRGVLS